MERLPRGAAHDLLRAGERVQRLPARRRSLDVVAQFGNHLVQRLELFVGDACLGNLHQFKPGGRPRMPPMCKPGGACAVANHAGWAALEFTSLHSVLVRGRLSGL